MNLERNQESGPPERPADDKPNPAPKSNQGRGLESFSPSGLLGFCVGDRYNLSHDRDFEWRDALGCLWLPGLGVIISVAIWLGQVGVPTVPLQVGTVVALVGFGIAMWRIGRSGRSD